MNASNHEQKVFIFDLTCDNKKNKISSLKNVI